MRKIVQLPMGAFTSGASGDAAAPIFTDRELALARELFELGVTARRVAYLRDNPRGLTGDFPDFARLDADQREGWYTIARHVIEKGGAS